MNLKKYHFIIILSATILMTVLATNLILSRRTLSENLVPFAVSPDILLITQPVYSINGRIIQISDNSIIVEQIVSQTIVPAALPPNGAAAPVEPKTILYTVKIDDRTAITSYPLTIPSLLNSTQPPTQKTHTINELKKKQLVNVTTREDLRLVKDNVVTATNISVNPTLTIINGSLVSLKEKTLTVKGITTMAAPAAAPAAPTESTFEVTVDENTEISRISAGKPVKVSLSSLKEGASLIIYSEDEIDGKSIRALRIEPVLPADKTTPSAILPPPVPPIP